MSAQLIALQLAQSEGGGSLGLLIGPAAAVGAYYVVWQHYRNANNYHSFEHETRVDAEAVTGSDRKVDEVKGTRRQAIEGANDSDHRARVHRTQ